MCKFIGFLSDLGDDFPYDKMTAAQIDRQMIFISFKYKIYSPG